MFDQLQIIGTSISNTLKSGGTTDRTSRNAAAQEKLPAKGKMTPKANNATPPSDTVAPSATEASSPANDSNSDRGDEVVPKSSTKNHEAAVSKSATGSISRDFRVLLSSDSEGDFNDDDGVLSIVFSPIDKHKQDAIGKDSTTDRGTILAAAYATRLNPLPAVYSPARV